MVNLKQAMIIPLTGLNHTKWKVVYDGTQERRSVGHHEWYRTAKAKNTEDKVKERYAAR